MNEYELKKEQKLEEKSKNEKIRKTKKILKTFLVWSVPLAAFVSFVWFLIKTGPTESLEADLNLCIQHANVGMHVHSDLKIVINGQEEKIPANIGVTPACMKSIHTHDASGKIHMEFKRPRDVKLGDFFQIWGKNFNSSSIFEYNNDGDKKVRLFVNDSENFDFESYIVKDGDKIEIKFE